MRKIYLAMMMGVSLILGGCATVTPIGIAAKNGDIHKVEDLLNKGADVNEVRMPGLSPLHETVFNNASLDIVRLLLDKGADVNKLGSGDGWDSNASGRPIHLAVYNGNADMVKLLIDRGADVSALDYSNQTPLQIANQRGYTAIAHMLETEKCKKITSTECGTIYQELGQFDKALAAQKKLIESYPNDSNSFATLAYLYYENKQYDETITAAKRAIELKSDNDVAYVNFGAAYLNKKQYDEAIKAFRKAIEINPGNHGAYAWMGRVFVIKDAYNEATDVYKKAVELQPNNTMYMFDVANTCRLMGKYDDAITNVNKAIELQSITGIGTSIRIKDHYPVVEKVVEAGPAKKAGIEAEDKIIRIDGQSTEDWTVEKIIQSVRGASGTQVVLTIERKGIGKDLSKLITRETIFDKDAANTFGLRSLIYRYKGNKEESFKDAEKSYSLDSANAWALIALGGAYLDKGHYDESLKLLSQVKDSSMARLYEATAYVKQGKTKEAVKIYLSIPEEEMSPKNIPRISDRQALLNEFKPTVMALRDKAKSFEVMNMHKEMLSALSEAIQIADDSDAQEIQEEMFNVLKNNPLLAEEVPEEARKHALRGEVLVKEGNFSEAVIEFKKAIQIAPYIARLYYNSAQVNAEIKNYPEAIRHMNMYLKVAADAPDVREAKDNIIKWEFMMERGQ